MNLSDLILELTVDPLGIGYVNLSSMDCVESLNARTRPGTKLSVTKEVFVNKVLRWNEVESLTAAKRDTLGIMLQADSLDLSVGGNPITYLATLFGPATLTYANYLALATPMLSRAEELGFGSISVQQVEEARR